MSIKKYMGESFFCHDMLCYSIKYRKFHSIFNVCGKLHFLLVPINTYNIELDLFIFSLSKYDFYPRADDFFIFILLLKRGYQYHVLTSLLLGQDFHSFVIILKLIRSFNQILTLIPIPIHLFFLSWISSVPTP